MKITGGNGSEMCSKKRLRVCFWASPLGAEGAIGRGVTVRLAHTSGCYWEAGVD